MKDSIIKRLCLTLAAGIFSLPGYVFASGFQLWEQDGASVGNYHAGRAAIAADASTAFYNPAGLVRIPNKQLVLGMDFIRTDFSYDGTIAVDTLTPPTPLPTKAQGGTFNFVPDVHYADPVSNNLFIGLSLVAPFGLKTDYKNDSIVRYAATLTSIKVIDFAPSLGFAINDKWSVGFGLDLEHVTARFDLVTGLFEPITDTSAKNSVDTEGLGYHAGILYQYSPQTRVGLGYQSKVNLRFRHGDSKFSGPLANGIEGGVQESFDLRSDVTLPATTTLSVFHSFNPAWDVMGTVSYTQWKVFKNVIMKNVAGIDLPEVESNSITVTIPQNYRNTWNYVVGANYHFNEQWFFRSGVGYDQTPANNEDRNLQLPDTNRIVLALGGHYQATKTLGFDAGWSHIFRQKVPVDVSQQVGAQLTTTDGNVEGYADVYGFQMTWDIV